MFKNESTVSGFAIRHVKHAITLAYIAHQFKSRELFRIVRELVGFQTEIKKKNPLKIVVFEFGIQKTIDSDLLFGSRNPTSEIIF